MFKILVGNLVFEGSIALVGAWGLTKPIAILRPQHPEDVRVIMYFFSLSFVLSTVLAVWTLQAGAIDQRGFHVTFGEVLQWLIRSTNDIAGQLVALCVLVRLILVPQFFG